jgi:DNA modification methylase
MENRFNALTSKEWLPFQKSWSVVESDEALIKDNLRFFTMPSIEPQVVYYSGPKLDEFSAVARSLGLEVSQSASIANQFALIDIRTELKKCETLIEFNTVRDATLATVGQVVNSLLDRRFVCVLASNLELDGALIPTAWDIGKSLANLLSLKDEKLLCREKNSAKGLAGSLVEYALYARKDGVSPHRTETNWCIDTFFSRSASPGRSEDVPRWFVLKPPSRKKGEILHPAKYPESLAEMFIQAFTSPGDNVIDPMSGTGSTQLAAVSLGRNGFGTELSPFFAELANARLSEFCNPAQGGLFESEQQFGSFTIIQADARQIPKLDFPLIDYACTSPPYWDMLNMKGAENQARRVDKGLQTNYSSDANDLGNVADYGQFMTELTNAYLEMFKSMRPKSYFTFVVKNIKKQGAAYPFAWDLTHRLLEAATPISEHFWLQDDLSIAPYGYGNTWVSNTFHQYCITVQLSA